MNTILSEKHNMCAQSNKKEVFNNPHSACGGTINWSPGSFFVKSNLTHIINKRAMMAQNHLHESIAKLTGKYG